MNFTFLEKLVVNYLESHPEIIERLVADLIQRLLVQFEQHQAPNVQPNQSTAAILEGAQK